MPSQNPRFSTSPKPSTGLSPTSSLMRPPTYSSDMRPTNLSTTDGGGSDISTSAITDMDNTGTGSAKRSTNQSMARSKKLRFLKHASVAGMNETKVDDITTDIIIPRERVISICSLDKDALDDYLNEGENSQEQEAELLKYFQQPNNVSNEKDDSLDNSNNSNSNNKSNSNSNSNTNINNTSGDENAPTNTSTGPYPVLENYQLFNNNQQNQTLGEQHQAHTIIQSASSIPQTPTQLTVQKQSSKKQEQINELRQYLHEKFQQQPPTISSSDKTLIGATNSISTSAAITSTNPLQMAPGSSWESPNSDSMSQDSAVASISTLSSDHQRSSNTSVTKQRNFSTGSAPSAAKRKLNVSIVPTSPNQPQTQPQLLRSVSASAAVCPAPLQSPNSRRKNFSFVPISPGPGAPSGILGPNTLQGSPFVSPRATQAIRKPINKDLTSTINNLHRDPLIGSYKTAFCKPSAIRSEISASAPVSPSVTPHHFQFGNTMQSNYNPIPNNSNQQQPQQQSVGSMSNPMYPMLESRSQSVPLHCQSPAFNHTTAPNTAYSSACNSIAQTPVPSEFADFYDENILDMLAESSVEQNIKLEENDIPDLLNAADLGGLSDICNRHNNSSTNSFNNMSRSVPSTPIPTLSYNSANGFTNHIDNNSNMALASAVAKHTFDIVSRSVPTTPLIGANYSNTPFRYSPEHNRDFLINGNTIDNDKNSQFFVPVQQLQCQQQLHRQPSLHQQQQQQSPQMVSHQMSGSTTLMPTSEMEMTNYNVVNDPIIDGSDLLNNL